MDAGPRLRPDARQLRRQEGRHVGLQAPRPEGQVTRAFRLAKMGRPRPMRAGSPLRLPIASRAAA
ncbi:hypothetical protein KL86PLE_30548 [uncultured Pleomorphomonas sp.]|uniref:Uncharacterized protein n=1 Tax=uncultured Pleomorphomonas sp. TaxID=442121 RepID=A0A212LEX0_9HYPH|nr:hypothetical protein KL86PLE_30548 [uncultured Pleomorphomonas sp.]